MDAPPWRACCWSHDFDGGATTRRSYSASQRTHQRSGPPCKLWLRLPSFFVSNFFFVPDAAPGVCSLQARPSLPVQFPSCLLFACCKAGSYTHPLRSVHAHLPLCHSLSYIPKTLGGGCAHFKSPSLLSHLPSHISRVLTFK